MNEQPLVSIIMIFFNEEKFIEEAIASVLAQTYEHWELLLVDDGSSDNSTVIAQGYVEKYPEKIHYLEHENHQNRGMSATRNLGISQAQGEYITFLDGDDVYLPHKLEQQIQIMESYSEVAMVYGHTQDWYGWTGKPEDIEHDLLYDLGVSTNNVIQPPILFNLCLQRQAPTPCTCSALMRREIIKDVGNFEESFRGLYEDQVFFMKVLLKAPVFVAGEFWDKYRRHPESCYSTAKRTGENHTLRLVFLNWLEKYLTEQAIENAEVRASIQKELFPYHHPILSRILKRIPSFRRK